jgi:hypothetical protein
LERALRAAQEAAEKKLADVAIGVRITAGPRLVFTIQEKLGGKVAETKSDDLDVVGVYLARAFNDPKGPWVIAVIAELEVAKDLVQKVYTVCARAGFKKAAFSVADPGAVNSPQETRERLWRGGGQEWKVEPTTTIEIDLRKYVPPLDLRPHVQW